MHLPNPAFVYGTAWKEDRTAALTLAALEVGFRAVDTANQRKHYLEVGVGEALRQAFDRGLTTRDAVWIQTMFTFQAGQDHRLPYDPSAPIAEQVAQSVASSLDHLGLRYLDSLILHGPGQRHGLGDADLEAWAALERALKAGHTLAIGVSNVSASQLSELCTRAAVTPHHAQIRTFARADWEAELRAVCSRYSITYQGFSLLTANREVWGGPVVARIAASHQITPAQVMYAFARQSGMLPLMGSTDRTHLAEALASLELTLAPSELDEIQRSGRP